MNRRRTGSSEASETALCDSRMVGSCHYTRASVPSSMIIPHSLLQAPPCAAHTPLRSSLRSTTLGPLSAKSTPGAQMACSLPSTPLFTFSLIYLFYKTCH